MGEVYSATDTRLDRTVAIKVLPAELASDPDRRERFEREAKAIAALNHPHICTLHDVGHADGTDFLVMEHLEGETLADRLARASGSRRQASGTRPGPEPEARSPKPGSALPLDEALTIAIQIADALDKAHRQGITHRDLKPGNIFLTKSGAKLLDFGLAKLTDPVRSAKALAERSTKLADALTAQGTILGTFHYMAPEQLEGREADARSDIWAFGCVVYEMVTGQRAFEGKTQASLISAIMSSEPPPPSSLETVLPAGIDYVVTTCLAKGADDRWQSARDLHRELKRIAVHAVAPAEAVVGGGSSGVSGWAWRLSVVAVLSLVAGASITWAVWGRTGDMPRSVERVFLTASGSPPPFTANQSQAFAVSPDGKHVVYRAGASDRSAELFVRSFDELEPRRIEGTAAGQDPIFSQDGEWIAFRMSGNRDRLLKVATSGGPIVTILESDETLMGYSWGRDDTVILGGDVGLRRVPGRGGTPERLTRADTEGVRHIQPHVLPDGGSVLFTERSFLGPGFRRVMALSLDSGEIRLVLDNAANAKYVQTGHLVYLVDDVLHAAAFDADRLEVTGPSMPLVQGIQTKSSTGAANFDVSFGGTLVYAMTRADSRLRLLAWADRQGELQPVHTPARPFFTPRVAPDGSAVAVNIRDGEDDIWLWRDRAETLTRFTFEPDSDRFPVWTSDSRALVFESHRTGRGSIFRKSVDGTGQVETILDRPSHDVPLSIHGTRVVLAEGLGLNKDLAWLDWSSGSEVISLAARDSTEHNGAVAPNGRWLAYDSDESGVVEVYVQSFPDPARGRWQVSQSGGWTPLWSPDGRELFYATPENQLAAVGVEAGETFEMGNRGILFDGATPGILLGTAEQGRAYDISRDGERFLVMVTAPGSSDSRNDIVLVLNWGEELKARVPTP